MKTVRHLRGRAVVLPGNNIDTDQIIPARFLKTTSKTGLGSGLFHDWRFEADGALKAGCPLNSASASGAVFLVAGDNFGCGSSREHATWALLDFGFEAIVAASFGDIFRQNALKNGLVPVVVPQETLASLVEALSAEPGAELELDLEAQSLTMPGRRRIPFPIDPFARHCLINGLDEMGYVLGHEEAIARFEASHPARFDTRLA